MRVRLIAPVIATLLALGLLAACSVERLPVDPTPSARPSTTANAMLSSSPIPPSLRPASPKPEPLPTLPPEPLALTASVQQDGVRVTIELERNPMPAGEPSWLTSEVANVGSEPILYGDDCSLVVVRGSIEAVAWQPGRQQQGKASEFKHWAMERTRSLGRDEIAISFTPEELLEAGHEIDEVGCGDMFRGVWLAPGESVAERSRWNGGATGTWAPPLTGRVPLTGSFDFYWGRPVGDPKLGNHTAIEVALEAWTVGLPNRPRLHPGEAIDVALAHPEFGRWLLSRPLRNAADPIVRFDPGFETWRVGLTSYYPTRTRVAIIDAATGHVLDIVGPTD